MEKVHERGMFINGSFDESEKIGHWKISILPMFLLIIILLVGFIIFGVIVYVLAKIGNFIKRQIKNVKQ